MTLAKEVIAYGVLCYERWLHLKASTWCDSYLQYVYLPINYGYRIYHTMLNVYIYSFLLHVFIASKSRYCIHADADLGGQGGQCPPFKNFYLYVTATIKSMKISFRMFKPQELATYITTSRCWPAELPNGTPLYVP